MGLFLKLFSVYSCLVSPVFQDVPISIAITNIYGPLVDTWVRKANNEEVVIGLVNQKAVPSEGLYDRAGANAIQHIRTVSSPIAPNCSLRCRHIQCYSHSTTAVGRHQNRRMPSQPVPLS